MTGYCHKGYELIGTLKDFKKTAVYQTADVLEVFGKNGIEYNDDFPEEELEKKTVVDFQCRGGWLSIELE